MYQINSGDLRDQIGANKGEASIFQPYETDYFTNQQKAANKAAEDIGKKRKEQEATKRDFAKELDIEQKPLWERDIPEYQKQSKEFLDYVKANYNDLALNRDPEKTLQFNRLKQGLVQTVANSEQAKKAYMEAGKLIQGAEPGEIEPESIAYIQSFHETPGDFAFDPTKIQKSFDRNKEIEAAREYVSKSHVTEQEGMPVVNETTGGFTTSKTLSVNKKAAEQAMRERFKSLPAKGQAKFKSEDEYVQEALGALPKTGTTLQHIPKPSDDSSSGYGADDNWGVEVGGFKSNVVAIKENTGVPGSERTGIVSAEGLAKYQPKGNPKIATSQSPNAILQGGKEGQTPAEYKASLDKSKERLAAGEYIVGEVTVFPVYKPGTKIKGVDVGGQIVPIENTNRDDFASRNSYTYQLLALLLPQYEGIEGVVPMYVPAQDVAASITTKGFPESFKEMKKQSDIANNKLKSGYHRKDGAWVKEGGGSGPSEEAATELPVLEGGKIDASNLIKNKPYTYNGKVYNWNGTKLILK